MNLPQIRLVWKSIGWKLGSTLGQAPFMTLLDEVEECSICKEPFNISNKVYITSDYDTIQNFKAEEMLSRHGLTSNKLDIKELEVMCEQCYTQKTKDEWILKAVKARQQGMPKNTILKHTKRANRAIISNKEFEDKLLQLLESDGELNA